MRHRLHAGGVTARRVPMTVLREVIAADKLATAHAARVAFLSGVAAAMT